MSLSLEPEVPVTGPVDTPGLLIQTLARGPPKSGDCLGAHDPPRYYKRNSGRIVKWRALSVEGQSTILSRRNLLRLKEGGTKKIQLRVGMGVKKFGLTLQLKNDTKKDEKNHLLTAVQKVVMRILPTSHRRAVTKRYL